MSKPSQPSEESFLRVVHRRLSPNPLLQRQLDLYVELMNLLHDSYMQVLEGCETREEFGLAHESFCKDVQIALLSFVADVMLEDVKAFKESRFEVMAMGENGEPIALQDKVLSRDH